MSNIECAYTGPKCSIPDTTLGINKKITAGVEIIRNGMIQTELLENPKWTLEGQNLGIIKDYKIELNNGEYTQLAVEDHSKNPLQFKIWKLEKEKVSVRCEGTIPSLEGAALKIPGNFSVRHPLSAEYKHIKLKDPYTEGGFNKKEWSFNIALETKVKLNIPTSPDEVKGTIGFIHLVCSERNLVNYNNKEEVIIDTKGEYILYPDPKKNTPVSQQKKVTRSDDKDTTDFSISQILDQNLGKSYEIHDSFKSYLMFKSDEPDSIWIPVITTKDALKYEYFVIHWGYKTKVCYQKKRSYWVIEEYEQIDYKEKDSQSNGQIELPTWKDFMINKEKIENNVSSDKTL